MSSTDSPDPRPRPSSTGGPGAVLHDFVVDGPLDVNVQNLRGDVTLRADVGTAVRVELLGHGRAGRELAEQMRVRCADGRLTVDPPVDQAQRIGGGLGGLFRGEPGPQGSSWADRLSDGLRTVVHGAEGLAAELDIVVLVPSGSRVVVSTGMGSVDLRGALGRVEGRTGTGDIALERGADEQSRLSTGTGDIRVGPTASDLAVTTGTGDVRVARMDGHVAATTGIGDIQVASARSGRLRARSGLGSVAIGVAPGTATRVDLATGLGDRDVQLDPTDGVSTAERTLEIEARSGKGDLRVMRADPVAQGS